MRKKGLQICEVPFECNHVLHFIFLYTQVIITPTNNIPYLTEPLTMIRLIIEQSCQILISL